MKNQSIKTAFFNETFLEACLLFEIDDVIIPIESGHTINWDDFRYKVKYVSDRYHGDISVNRDSTQTVCRHYVREVALTRIM